MTLNQLLWKLTKEKLALLHFRTPPRVRVRATVKLPAAFFNDESSITIGGGYKSAIAPKNLPFMRLILDEQQKYLQSFINNATYHSMNPDTDVTYQTINLFSSDSTI